jgi:hypothetical protein
MGKLNRHCGDTRESPKENFHSHKSFFCEIAKKSGCQNPLKKTG